MYVYTGQYSIYIYDAYFFKYAVSHLLCVMELRALYPKIWQFAILQILN